MSILDFSIASANTQNALTNAPPKNVRSASMDEIQPCPFCGSDELSIEDAVDEWTVHCDECFAKGPTGPTEAIAYERWNFRGRLY